MARILIVYSTRAGATAHVANLLARELRAAGNDVSVASSSTDPSPEGVDFFVVGSGILASNWNAEAIGWLQRHADELEGRTALFNVCLSAAEPDQRERSLAFNERAASIVTPLSSESFAGRYQPAKARLWERLLLKAMKQTAQDHIDPDAISAWGKQLAELVDKQMAG